MKLTVFFVLALTLHASSHSLGQTVTLKVKDVSIKEVFRKLEQQTGLNFMIDEALIEKMGKITLDVHAKPLREVLDLCLQDKGLHYTIQDDRIVITAVGPPPPADTDIHGQITDSLGNPLAGASVFVKGTNRGVRTDGHGHFELRETDASATLVITYTGFAPREYPLNGKNAITIVLDRVRTPLDEVQIIAYGTTTKRYSAGDVTTVKAEDIRNQPVSNVLSALQGMVAGLEIANNSGAPGDNANARIRGINSVNNVRGILVLIDGVPGDINTIPPADIASIDVLKDAASTAIYGARGSDGVIIITTKRGAINGGNQIHVSGYNSISQPTKVASVLNTAQYRMLRKEAFANDGITPTIGNAPDLFMDSTVNTDWGKELYKPAQTQDYQLNFTGGNAGVSYYLSGGYRNEDAIVPGNWGLQKENARASLDIKVFKGLTVGGGLAYIHSNVDQYGSSIPSAIYYALPMIPFRDARGNTNLTAYSPYTNPNRLLTVTNPTDNNELLANFYLNYTIWDHLVFRTDLNYQYQTGKNSNFEPTTSNTDSSTYNFGSFGFTNSKTLNVEPQLSYDRSVGRHYFKLLAGTTLLTTNSDATAIYAGTNSNAIDALSLLTSGDITYHSYTVTPYRFNSLFGRLNYRYNGRYLLEAVLRRDGSSRFGPDYRFGNFYSIAGGWIFSDEDVIRRLLKGNFYGKLRASYGTTGNDNIGDFGWLANSSTTSDSYGGNTTLYVSNLANPVIRWELTKKLDIGLDLSFLHDQLSITADYYHNRTSNTLFAESLSYVTGFNSIESNLNGVISNKGVELAANYNMVNTRNFKWKTGLTLTTQKNQLVSLPGLANNFSRYTYKVGQPLALVWGFKYQGVDPSNGLAKFQDVDKNGFISSYTPDWQVLGKTIPDYYGGWNNFFTFRKFDMQVFAQFSHGITKPYNVYGGVGNTLNLPVSALQRWTHPGQITDVPRAAAPGTAAFNNNDLIGQSSFAYSDASYLRVKNITLGYTFSGRTLLQAHITGLRVYLSAYNLFTFSPYKGDDPEGTSVTTPMTKIYTLGANLDF